ncbi:hypothetical protein [Sphingobium sp. CCH11-B1]|jgi:hypothetical protein|uniref:hypothetical protein n=1 Tax=Sphingobium sp. CCH11-B1 TaxID=1768781 RepID=UPI000ADA31F9|nr:hypothetical protein [Sphingobium sp. CCH11-B1]MEA3389516.1 hypothetical protein [Pseudomonadota bacterium]
MSFAASLLGAALPLVLMLSPFVVMAARACPDSAPAAQSVEVRPTPCPRPLPMLM